MRLDSCVQLPRRLTGVHGLVCPVWSAGQPVQPVGWKVLQQGKAVRGHCDQLLHAVSVTSCVSLCAAFGVCAGLFCEGRAVSMARVLAIVVLMKSYACHALW
jgi:hypothetical protein